ncbi:Transcriptional regulator of ribosomal biogenesis proteins [Coemansia sp. IMI 203386]|nr:Transcriptional regulator of ribosomal biogenesis proteins [Coemansia sp. IMI 203386]
MSSTRRSIHQSHRLFDLAGLGSTATALSNGGYSASATSQHIHSGSMPVADEDFYYPRDLEASFCRDFSCCGLILNDLHDLLQHYEECHVRFEDDEAQADLAEGCFFDDEWSSADCLAAAAPGATDLSSFGLTLEQQLLLGATTAESSASSTAVPSPTLHSKCPSDVLAAKSKSSAKGAPGATPPLSPANSAMSSVTGSPQDATLPFTLDVSSLVGRKRPASSVASAENAGDQSPTKRHATMPRVSGASAGQHTTSIDAAVVAAANSSDLAFSSSVLGLYDDDIIAAIASATDPLFLSTAAAAAAAAAGNSNASGHATSFGRKRSDSDSSCDSLTEAANAAVLAVSGEDFDDDIHLPPSVTAAMAGAVAAAAAAKAHGLVPRDDKPYRCPVPSCDKAYKNPNGLKYHNLHGHCHLAEEARAGSSKPYRCRVPECYKAYKNLNGLKYHVQHAHCAMIPSIRDLPPNATPAEVAAAVAAAAAAAAAAAVASSSSSPSSPAASPVPSTPMSVVSSANGSFSRAPSVSAPPRAVAGGLPSSASAPATGPRVVRALPMSSGPGNSRPMGPVNGSASGVPMRMVHSNSASSTGAAGPNPAARLPPQRISNGVSQQQAVGGGVPPRPGTAMMQRRPQQPMAINKPGAFVAGPRPRPAQTTSTVPPLATGSAPVRRPMAVPNAAPRQTPANTSNAAASVASTAPRQQPQPQQSQQATAAASC